MASSRRNFLQGTAWIALGAAVAKAGIVNMPKRPLGKSGIEVSIIGMGGFHLGATEDQETATKMVHAALDAGINFFDNAWEYHDGESEARMGKALAGRRQEAVLMTKVCTHGRDKNVAMQMLEESLRRLQTDHLDVWQIHEVIYENDPQRIFRPNGAIEALAEAKKQGKVRLVGFTGHKLPSIHMRMLESNFPFDTVQMPLNPFDGTYRSFEQTVLPEANRRGISVLGMKSLGGSGEMVKKGGVKVADALRYAMSLPVATTISGMDSPEVLAQNLEILSGFSPMSRGEMQTLRERCQPNAADGRMELFKSTMMYDGAIGREQHGFPSASKLPA